MSRDSSPADIEAFARWVADRVGAPPTGGEAPAMLLAAARAARDEFLLSSQELPAGQAIAAKRGTSMEVLDLLAAASADQDIQLPQLTTAKGFQVTLARDDSGAADAAIGVLVRCPAELIGLVCGNSTYLWKGAERFHLGQFDMDGKALGFLPTGTQITAADFSGGKVQLETP